MKREHEQNRVVVITGAAGGMGSLLTARFLHNDDSVIAVDRNKEGLATLRPGPRGKLRSFAVDISKDDDCGMMASFTREQAERVDVLINCAGYFPTVPFEEMTSKQWREIIEINLTGHFLMIQAMLPLMKGRGWGRIVNFGSASIFEGVPEQAHYVSAKAGIVGFSRSLARALGQDGITVNVIAPGLTLTPPVRKNMPEEMTSKAKEKRALRRDEVPADLVGTVFFLASPDADFITGQMITVDGGDHFC